jgi:hypothetical protein
MTLSRISILALALLSGCAGMERGCSSYNANAFGADWVIVQMDDRGSPYRCWTLNDVSVSNEEASDGIYWLSPNGHLVHISGHYNRVQVEGSRWDEAYRELGLTEELCRRVQEPLRLP